MVPKASKAFRWQLPCRALPPVNCTQTGWLLAGLMLALLAFWTLALGRWPLDTGPVGPWSPSALVAWGSALVFASG